MPAYEYHCEACDHQFDARQKMSDRPLEVCPKCGGALHRLISGGAAAISHEAEPACAMRATGGCCGGMCGH